VRALIPVPVNQRQQVPAEPALMLVGDGQYGAGGDRRVDRAPAGPQRRHAGLRRESIDGADHPRGGVAGAEGRERHRRLIIAGLDCLREVGPSEMVRLSSMVNQETMVNQEIAGPRLVRLRDPHGDVRVGLMDGEEIGVLETDDVVALLEADEVPRPRERLVVVDPQSCTPPDPWRLLAPLIAPETWAAGVTYERSRDARLHESQVADVYDLVYEAQRPELFLKDTAGRRTVGPGEPIAVRADASWTVPEPELAVVLGARGEPLAVTIGNDVSSRDIEGANPLYLPQAKIYAGACALGPALLVPVDWSVPFDIELRIVGEDGRRVFSGKTTTANMRRSLAELIEYLRRDNPLPAGSVLLTGTGIVPPDSVTLTTGQSVEITISGIGTLQNPVGAVTDSEQRPQETADV
jgi:2-dehydro-3-deoxy-D-arabinonate dehydratase